MRRSFPIVALAAVTTLLLPLAANRGSAQMYYGRQRPIYYNPLPGNQYYSSGPYSTGSAFRFNGYPPRYYNSYAQGGLPTYLTSINYPNIYGSYGYQFAPGPMTYGLSPSGYTTAPTTYGQYVSDDATRPTFRDVPDTATIPLRTGELPRYTTAAIDVRLPADAELRFEGVRTEQTGALRRFVTPDLDPETSYRYDIVATWTENGQRLTRTRHVPVHAGDRFTVDFTTPEANTEEGTSTLKTRPLPNR